MAERYAGRTFRGDHLVDPEKVEERKENEAQARIEAFSTGALNVARREAGMEEHHESYSREREVADQRLSDALDRYTLARRGR